MATLRLSGREVNGRAVLGLFAKLQALWALNPVLFVEFVRHSRTRSYQPFGGRGTLKVLLNLGLVGEGRGSPVHDAIRDLVAVCVEGDGLAMRLFHPLEGAEQDSRPEPTAKLRDGTVVNPRIVATILMRLQQLLESDYVAFTEFVRFARGEKKDFFTGTLPVLISFGVIGMSAGEAVSASLQHVVDLIQEFIPDVELPQIGQMVACDLFVPVIQNAVVGQSGLDFNIRSPYAAEAKQATATPQAHASGNGEAPKKQTVSKDADARKHANAMHS